MGKQGCDLVGIVPPDLTVGIEGTSAVEVDIVSRNEPKSCAKTRYGRTRFGENYVRVLELHIVGVGRPIGDIGGILYCG